MSRFNDNLNHEQELAWLQAQDEARQLLAAGVHTLRESRFMDPVRESVLSTWAMGAEKLLKVALGLHSVSHGKDWPSKKEMQTYRHQIEKLDAELMRHIDEWMEGTPRSDYLEAVVSTVKNDPAWPKLRAALGLYGDQGRFRSLDALAGSSSTQTSPYEAWEDAVQLAWRASPRMASWWPKDWATMSPTEFDQLSLDLHAAVADSVVNWWFMITRLARHGFLGERGKAFGADAEPQNALPAVEVLPTRY